MDLRVLTELGVLEIHKTNGGRNAGNTECALDIGIKRSKEIDNIAKEGANICAEYCWHAKSCMKRVVYDYGSWTKIVLYSDNFPVQNQTKSLINQSPRKVKLFLELDK